ncbi:tripartite tricarboxylate transporter substrate binding protein [Pusillimonas sp. ANT_WB101]|uniref:Bug family tripartite tricarboxylate transporter substrate binding protein n=1 Tax=Pusillimonas sp. ANT_WB101 TaxID=2597356 RepID=UPI0011ED2F13|nr:tripartite tricarboxylate transporter substrate binding protein [Pusillimonas sp. ANT_WB101]KAA0911311.1 tripartite tricarboxylate transporter substrate binding protein [Pusillimonas sp. ANT_WB101]
MIQRSNFRKGFRHFLTGSVTFALIGMATAAQAWPDRPIKMIVPFPAGGINDVVGRLTAAQLEKELNTTVIVDNRTGAGGTIGTALAAGSEPDGYTILLGASSTIAVAPNLYKNLTYSPTKDLQAIGGIASAASVLVVGEKSKWKDLDQLINAGKQDSAHLNYGSAGAGTSHHIQTEMLKLRTGAKWTHVPYRGGAPAMTDLIGGQIDFLLEPLPTALQNINSGRVRPIAVTTKNRSSALPDVKTMEELGVKDFDASLWFGVFVPAGVDAEKVAILSDALKRVFAKEQVKKDFAERGLTTYDGTREQFNDFVVSEIKVWGDVIDRAKISVE